LWAIIIREEIIMIKLDEAVIDGIIFKISKESKTDNVSIIIECDYPQYTRLQNILYSGKVVQVVYLDFNFYTQLTKIKSINKYEEIEIYFK
jgi:hypothetical protein